MKARCSIAIRSYLTVAMLVLSAGTALAAPVTYTFSTTEWNGSVVATVSLTFPTLITADTSVSAPFPAGDSCSITGLTCTQVLFYPSLNIGSGPFDDLAISSAEDGGSGFAFPAGTFDSFGTFSAIEPPGQEGFNTGTLTISSQSVPEPAGLALFLIGAAGIGVARRRVSRTAA